MTSGLYHCIALTVLSVVWSAERLKEYYPTEYKYILADLDRCRTGNGTTKSIKHKHYNIISSALHTTQADFFKHFSIRASTFPNVFSYENNASTVIICKVFRDIVLFKI